MISPYAGLPVDQWETRTRQLITEHPLKPEEILEVVIKAWQDIFVSAIGTRAYRIGVDVLPQPQVMAFFLHELIPLEFTYRYPQQWRRENSADEKDLVYAPDPLYSIEIKTSSSPRAIFGNRSYTQDTVSTKKIKSGYYLALNFEKFSSHNLNPKITLVRFGWLDHADWIGQRAASGQQARLNPDALRYKLLQLPLQG